MGGYRLSPFEQVRLFSDYLKKYGIRLIYCPLPNKGEIYPDLLDIEDEAVTKDVEYVCPQNRNFVYELLKEHIECVDVYEAFMKEKVNSDECLYEFGYHSISSFGAKVVANEIGDYLGQEGLRLPKSDRNLLSFKRIGKKSDVEKNRWRQSDIYYCLEKIETDGENITIPYLGDNTSSPLVIMGDCNLEHEQEVGAGIAANLSYRIKYPIQSFGRQLLFEMSDGITEKTIKQLLDKKIVIYCAFADAGFVRTSIANIRRLGRPSTWNTLMLQEL